MQYAVVIENAGNNYSAYCPDVPGCIATGETVEDAVQQMQEALTFHLEGMAEDGESAPEPATHVAYVDVGVPVEAVSR